MDVVTRIHDELTEKTDRFSYAGSSVMIVCPFHADNTPSLGVNLYDEDIPTGFFNCLGCGTKGPWNVLAKELNMTQYKDWELGFRGASDGKGIERSKRAIQTEDEKIEQAIKTKATVQWPHFMEWRGYSGTLIQKLGGLMYNQHMRDNAKDDGVLLFFPIYVNGKLEGGVSAYKEKRKDGASYKNVPGKWAKTFGLLGYDYVRSIVKAKHKAGQKVTRIALVEGPRDVLRLLDNKILSLAVLGVNTFTVKKLRRILNVSEYLEEIFVIGDNDAAGQEFYKTVKRLAAEDGYMVKVRCLSLPREKDKNGKLIKMDPDNAPQHIIDEIKDVLTLPRCRC